MLYYTLIVSQKEVFTSHEISYVIHEMLSIIYEKIKRDTVNTNIADIYIEEYEDIHNKKYKMITNTYYYNSITQKVDKKPSPDLLHLINELMNNKSNNNMINNNIINNNIINNKSNNNTININNTIHPTSIELPLDNLNTIEPELNSNLDYIQLEINRLQQQKQDNIEKINKIKQEQDEDLERLLDMASNENFKIKQEYYKKEKEEEKQKMYSADKRAYKLLKDDILSGKLLSNNISPIFKNKYLIFEILNKDNNLEDYASYSDLLEQLNNDKTNIQISEKYDDIFNSMASDNFIIRDAAIDCEIPDILP